AVPSATM
nr:hypothetical protein [Emiliania huxleyi virus 86]